MKKIFILIGMIFLLGVSYAESGVSSAIDAVLRMTNEEQRKEIKGPYETVIYEYWDSVDKLYNYKIISEKEFEERGVKYAIVDVEVIGPNPDEVYRVLTSEYFIKLGNLYKDRKNWEAFNKETEEDTDWNEYYKKQEEFKSIIYKDLGNVLKKTKFIKEKKRYELYIVSTENEYYTDNGWAIFTPAEKGYALYDPKIEKYLENNLKFIKDYNLSSNLLSF